ncbi:hypothetical protein N5E37_02305 [Acinetobacter johnsonii]|uniref:hypothetical protein n=1 Tax=Acinetobacter johnsonii TaxID=40214 RepID=UPI002446B0FD|nr:hypothetical protein [Acinetobacter johnsonii]MDH1725029.1 hypothetical protein [Acinetobacter johnsonii]
MKFIIFVVCAIGLLLTFSDKLDLFTGDNPTTYFLLVFLIFLSLILITLLIIFAVVHLSKNGFYALIVTVFGAGFILTNAYLVFMANYVYSSYKYPGTVISHSIDEIGSGMIPTLFKRPFESYMGDNFYESQFKKYDEYLSHSTNIKEYSSHLNHSTSTSTSAPYYDDGGPYEPEAPAYYDDAQLYEANDAYNSGQGVHEVSGYTREDGTEVSGYLRTNPDGIEENNFSYDGYK